MLLRTCLRPIAVAAAVFAVGACGDDEPATTSATGASTVTVTAPAADPLAGATTTPVTVPSSGDVTALLTDVRAAAQDGYDRVVFEFRNRLPGYSVGYAERPIRQDGSGRTVAVAGASVLEVRMENALDADLSRDPIVETYTGPRRFSPQDTVKVAELVRTGGFEGVLTWVIGVRDQSGFKVSTLDSPSRLVIDVRSR